MSSFLFRNAITKRNWIYICIFKTNHFPRIASNASCSRRCDTTPGQTLVAAWNREWIWTNSAGIVDDRNWGNGVQYGCLKCNYWTVVKVYTVGRSIHVFYRKSVESILYVHCTAPVARLPIDVNGVNCHLRRLWPSNKSVRVRCADTYTTRQYDWCGIHLMPFSQCSWRFFIFHFSQVIDDK